MNKKWAALAGAAALLTILTGCDSKAAQPYNDAPVKGHDNAPATIIYFPDGFSNVARKCVGGDGVYVVFHNDKAYGSTSVVPNDPACGR